MKLSISNIAWKTHNDPQILETLQNYGIKGIEVAPTKLWPNWENASYRAAVTYRKMMRDQGLEIPALQAILFNKPELQLFDKNTHPAFLDHLKFVAELANGLGSKVLIFGAPKNRIRGQLPYSEACKIAADFFSKAGEVCYNYECCIGLEHNPVEYGCDFVTNMADALEMVKSVNHLGFRLHLDSAGLFMCGGDITELIASAGNFVHYHISEPMLNPICNGVIDHKKALRTLKKVNYNNWISIEMKQPPTDDLLISSIDDITQIIKVI